MPSPSLPYGIPAPRTWSLTQPIKAPYLRADAAQAVALLGGPPVFIGQQQTIQSIPTNADTAVIIDTELWDNAFGHLVTVTPASYFPNLPGWWLCEGTSGINYTGGAGAVTAGIGIIPAGGSLTTYYGQRAPSSGTVGQYTLPSCSKLIQAVTTPRSAPGDQIQLILNQNSGAPQNSLITTSRQSWLQARWAAASAGSAPLVVPANGPWPSGTTLTAPATGGTSTTVSVASAAGLIAGGTIGLNPGASNSEVRAIANTYVPGSLSVPLTLAVSFNHAIGEPVTVPVSAAWLNASVRDTVNFLIYPPITEVFYAAGTATVPNGGTSLPGAAGTTVIPFDTKRADNYAAYSTSTHVWTAPVAGTYYAYCQCHQSMNSTSQALAAGLVITSANYNGGAAFTWWGGTQAALAGAAAGNCAITRQILRLNAGDTVQGGAFQKDSGTATTVLDVVTGASVSESRLIMMWRGA